MWNVFTAIKVCNTHLNTMKVRDKLLNNRFEYPNIMTIRKEGLLLPSFLENISYIKEMNMTCHA